MLVSAYMCGAERLLDSEEVTADTVFQVCLDLADFPLFPDELDSIAEKLQALIADSGIPCTLDLRDAARHFFDGGGEMTSADRISEEVLCDSFWRMPSGVRPLASGDWALIRSPAQGLQLDRQGMLRNELGEAWHNGDWPPGFCVPLSEHHQLHSNTLTWGWLRAPQEFWSSAVAVPFQRFHPAS